MIGFQIIQFFIFWIGCYECMIGFLHVPNKKISKKIFTYLSREETKKTKDMYFLEIASHFSNYIPISEYKREKIENQLKITRNHMKAETYIAFIWVKTGFYMILSFLFLYIPFLGVILFGTCFLIGINTYFLESSRLEVSIRKKRICIEKELPRLANTITQELCYTRDVIHILENYMKHAGEEMTEELKITIADMKSGNYEMALTRMEARISSVMLSQVIRGLMSVIRGDDGIFYFQMLSHDLRKLEVQALKTEAIKQPQKIGKYTLFIFLCFLLIIFTALGISMGTQIKSIF
jgi:tight adherence protein C